MKQNILKKIFVIAVAAAVIIPGASALAKMGMGFGYHHGGSNYGVDLTDEQKEQIAGIQETFYNNTSDIRQALKEKNLELRLILTKENIDAKKAKAVQKEISVLQGKFAEKRVDYMIKLKKIAPEINMGYGHKMGGKGYHGGGGFHGGGFKGNCGSW
jgi:Spy/CpxP family protein refolding chaperone